MTEQEYDRYLRAVEAWDNNELSLDEVKRIALQTLQGDELEQALLDIEGCR